jgi:excisionase family DNA binding protein
MTGGQMRKTEEGASALTATLSEREAAKRIGIAEITLYRLRKAGKVPYVRAGRRVLYRRSALDAWLERNERGGLA